MLLLAIHDMKGRERVLGLDYGHRRIGVAVSDPLGITAQGLDTVDFQDEESAFKKLAELISQLKVNKIVVGMPFNLKGQRGCKAEEVIKFINKLRNKFNLPIVEWDERFSSLEAERILKACGQKPSRVKRKIDQIAATLILQSYLESTKPVRQQ